MKIEIVIHHPHEVITRYGNNAYDINEKVYETLTKYGIDEETAIDCACWCELALYGESYNTENFDVYVSDGLEDE